MLFITGIAISFFLSALLLLKKNKSSADKILACWITVIGFHLLLYYSFITGSIYSYPWLLGIHFPLPLMHGPFLFLYARALTGNPLNARKGILHFMPAILCYAYLVHYFLLPASEKIAVFKNKGAGYETFMTLMFAAIIVSGFVYVILTMQLHRQHRRNILHQFSSIEKINLDWIQYLMYGSAVIWAFVVYGDDNLIFGTVVFFVLFMGFFGIRQTPVFTAQNHQRTPPVRISEIQLEEPTAKNSIPAEPAKPVEPPSETEGEKSKYQKSGLDEEELQRIHVKLTELMEREKLYTNPELTLGDMAQQLNIHPNYLSQVINSVAKKNFYDYINSQRVEEFNKMLMDEKNQKFTLLSLAYECGFNSKTSFNRNFRKVTGLSPSEFLKREKLEVRS